jgi:hypothetical protein
VTETTLHPCPPRPRAVHDDAPELVAEQHLVRRILLATAIATPVGAVIFAALVGVAMMIVGEPILVPAAMGAGVGILAGSFFGMWAGLVASVQELDQVDLHLARARSSTPEGG